MKLFREDNYELFISEEAYAIKAFNNLFKRDKTKDKKNAIAELSFCYFLLDPRSEFNYIVEEESKISEIKSAIGLPEK